MKGNCPHLGLLGDPDTILAYSDPANHCQAVSPPEPVNLTHQSTVCLTREFTSCPVYRGKTYSFPEHRSLPLEIRGHSHRREPVRFTLRLIFVGLVIALVSLAIIITSLKSPNASIGAQSEQMIGTPLVQTTSSENLIPPSKSSNSIFLPLSIYDVEESLTPTASASPTLKIEMLSSPQVSQTLAITSETCIPPVDWVIYTVRSGDTLAGIAISHGITFAEIVDANCLDETTVIYIGQQLYVPFLKPSQPIQKTNPPQPVSTYPPPSIPTNPPPPPTSIPTEPQPPTPMPTQPLPPTPKPTQPPPPTLVPTQVLPTEAPTPVRNTQNPPTSVP